MKKSKILFALVWLIVAPRFAGAVDYYFPVIAAGFLPGSTDQFYVTELVINNPANLRVNGYLTFYSLEGTPMDVTLRFAGGPGSGTTDTDSSFAVSIPGNGAWRAYTSENGALRTGWVALDMDDFVNPVAMFSINSKTTGVVSEATVFDSYPATRQRIFGDRGQRSNFITQFKDPALSDTGVAIANIGLRRATTTIRLLDSAGQASQSVSVTLEPLSSIAKFLKDFFPSLTSFQGTVELQSDAPVACLGLRFTGTVFTTIPVAVIQ